MKNIFWAVGFLGLLACLYVVTGAETKTGTLQVSASVPALVSVQVSPLNFGELSSGNPTTAEGTIEITAPVGHSYYIALSSGQYFDSLSRNMGLMGQPMPLSVIPYELYSDIGRTVIWGDSDFANSYPLGQAMGPYNGVGAVQQHPVYGTASAFQANTEGPYSDLITVTVHY